MPVDSNKSPTFRKSAKEFTIHEGSSSPSDPGLTPKQGIGAAATMKTFGAKLQINDVALPLTTSRKINANVKPGERRVESGELSAQESSSTSSGDDHSSFACLRGAVDASKYPRFQHYGAIGQAGRAHAQDTASQEPSEIESLRKQLAQANVKIAAMDHELSQQSITSKSINQVLRSPSNSNFQLKDSTDELISRLTNSPAPITQSNVGGSAGTSRPTDQSQGAWNDAKLGPLPFINTGGGQFQPPTSAWNSNVSSSWSPYDARAASNNQARVPTAPQPLRPTSLRVDTWAANQYYTQGMGDQGYDQNHRRGFNLSGRPDSAISGSFHQGNVPFHGNVPPTPLGYSPPMTPMQAQQMNMMSQVPNAYSQRSVSNELSPVAVEFNTGAMQNMSSFPQNVWNAVNAGPDNSSGYMPPMEPMNYRRLLDRNISCNWKYVVDKIVCSNDQQASIFLQQKLKISSPEQKHELVDAIIAQAYPLMINRFGNFLVQRCFEHGSREQIIEIASAIRGNTLNLSMDPFGCHVVQKAFDVVPEDYKAIMVHELLSRIPETVIHRYACHVWQKLFELRWSESPPQIMKYVNEALRGMWHEVALGETGSLVVQNIFENCLEEDKRPCINEVLASIDIIAHGQFGNWCIQHICEHGLPADKSRAIEHVLRLSTEYSTDQFASKVVEKCLKIGGSEFTERYLERVCEGRQDRPRMPLIDIAGDQYGNYLVQYILIHASPQHRELVSTHVRKHMVSLRGSKFGSRVAMLCSNPAVATRPGPPAGMQMNNRFMHGMGRAPPPYR